MPPWSLLSRCLLDGEAYDTTLPLTLPLPESFPPATIPLVLFPFRSIVTLPSILVLPAVCRYPLWKLSLPAASTKTVPVLVVEPTFWPFTVTSSPILTVRLPAFRNLSALISTFFPPTQVPSLVNVLVAIESEPKALSVAFFLL